MNGDLGMAPAIVFFYLVTIREDICRSDALAAKSSGKPMWVAH